MPLPKGVKKVQEDKHGNRWYKYREFTCMFSQWHDGDWQISMYDDKYDYDVGMVNPGLPFQRAMAEFVLIADGRRDEWTPQDYVDEGAEIAGYSDAA
jgi:hypothetical protein